MNRVSGFLYQVTIAALLMTLSTGFAGAESKKAISLSGRVVFKYKINIPLPTVTQLDGCSAFQVQLRQHVFNEVSDSFADKLIMQIEYPEGEVLTDTVSGGYQLFKTGSVIGAKYLLVSYVPPAAHPTYDAVTLNYNKKEHHVLRLADLFRPGYLNILSRYSRAFLKHQGIEGDMMLTGTRPQLDNFSHWNLVQKGLLLSFIDGQVGPHAIGQPSVLVPKRVLKPILSPEGNRCFDMAS